MGTSKPIEVVKEKDVDFSSMMNQLSKSAEEDSKKYFEEFENSVKKFYADSKYSFSIVEQKKHLDYQLETELTFENISKVISDIANQLFAGATKTEETKAPMIALAPYQVMAINVASNIISNVLAALSNKQSAQYQFGMQDVSVCPGVTLHLCVVNKSYEGRTFFRNTMILQNYIFYKLIFSKEKAGVEADISFLIEQMKSMEKSSSTYNTIQDNWINLITSDEYLQELDINGVKHRMEASYVRIMDELELRRGKAYESIKRLASAQNSLDPQGGKGLRSNKLARFAPNAGLRSYLMENE